MNQNKPQATPDDTELLRLKAGYSQHTSLNFPNTTLILKVLAQMKNQNKSEYSIKFVDKALTLRQQIHKPKR